MQLVHLKRKDTSGRTWGRKLTKLQGVFFTPGKNLEQDFWFFGLLPNIFLVIWLFSRNNTLVYSLSK